LNNGYQKRKKNPVSSELGNEFSNAVNDRRGGAKRHNERVRDTSQNLQYSVRMGGRLLKAHVLKKRTYPERKKQMILKESKKRVIGRLMKKTKFISTCESLRRREPTYLVMGGAQSNALSERSQRGKKIR